MADQYSMQAFGTPYGPLVAPMIPQGTDIAANMMTGFQIAANNNAKMRALERQNLMYQLGEQRLQMQHEIAMERNQRAIDRLEAQKDRWGDLFFLSDQEHTRKEDQFLERMKLQADARESAASASAALSNLRASENPADRPGGSNFPYAAQNAVQPYLSAMPQKDQLAMRNAIATEHNAAHARDVSNYKLMRDTLNDDVGNVLGYDSNLKPDYTGVFNPNALKPVTTGYLWNKKPVPGTYEVEVSTYGGAKAKHIVTADQLATFNKRWQDVQTAYKNLTKSRFLKDPEAGVTPPPDPSQGQIDRKTKAAAVIQSTDPSITPAMKAAAQAILNEP